MKIDKRIEHIDALRGFSMLLVLYFHIPSYCLGNAYMGFNDILEWVRMPLFFFISGFVFYKADRIWNYETIKKVLIGKFMVQIIPMAFFMFLYLFLFDYMELSSLGSDKKGYWYTFVLFEYFVLYIGGETLLNKQKTNQGEFLLFFSVLFISLISFYYAKYYTRYGEELGIWKDILGFFSFVKFKHLIFFWFGTFARKHFDIFTTLTNKLSFLIVILILYLTMTIFPIVYHAIGLEYITFALTGLSITILIYTFFRINERQFTKDKWVGKTLQFIGIRTLDIYLIHYFFLPYHILQDFGVWIQLQNNKLLEVGVILILTACLITISLLVSSLIRHNPFLAHILFGVPNQKSLPKFGETNNNI